MRFDFSLAFPHKGPTQVHNLDFIIELGTPISQGREYTRAHISNHHPPHLQVQKLRRDVHSSLPSKSMAGTIPAYWLFSPYLTDGRNETEATRKQGLH